MEKSGGILKLRPNSGPRRMIVGVTAGERLIHALTATVLAVVIAMALLLEPVDWGLWKLQSRLGDARPSGEIAYLHIDPDVVLQGYPEKRYRLARALDQLRAQGAERVFLNIVLAPSASPHADAILARSMAAWGSDLTIVNRIDIGPDGENAELRTADLFAAGHPRVWQGTSSEWPGYVWKLLYSYRTTNGVEPSFAAALGKVDGIRSGDFLVSYGIRSRSMPTIAVRRLLAGDTANMVAGKTIVIGTSRTMGSAEYHVPGQALAPPSYVPIHAAETLKREPIVFVPGFVAAAVLALFLGAAALIDNPDRRRLGYGAAIALPLYLFGIAGAAGLRIELSYCLALMAAFGALRTRSNWKLRLEQVDPDTGLANFRAFMRHLASSPGIAGSAVVAKIHGYETILRSLNASQRAAYVTKLVERLRVGDPKLLVFAEGHYLAWTVDHQDEQNLRGHLEGLRAIFAAPVALGEHRVDVGITFGAAKIQDQQHDRSLAAALAAVEGTSEALEPIKLDAEDSHSDALWDLSLRSRIDAAMEAGEVFCVYQPKMDIAADRIIGVEALVRWEDPERGFIPPLHFVMQCEKAGRMEYLTRYVLQSACSAAKLLHFRGSRITMSVNISATLLNDMRIVGIVRNVLQVTDFDPNYLMLEITETARIRDLTQARSVLKALKALGTHLSMDDFGVGAANFEALRALPFDEIKIDRQFITGAASSVKTRAIAASIVGLGASARIAVVAEGAETKADLQMLREIGCWHVQGYALAKPMQLTNLLTFIAAGKQQTSSA